MLRGKYGLRKYIDPIQARKAKGKLCWWCGKQITVPSFRTCPPRENEEESKCKINWRNWLSSKRRFKEKIHKQDIELLEILSRKVQKRQKPRKKKREKREANIFDEILNDLDL